ncbi:hypothetical protein F4780DRAFT_780831 [Xylariomycetidae sp. FL0641]|nr:hypothetical protein F4780DRAFT_780831 [Xylariomycetidae sp. FL0641]
METPLAQLDLRLHQSSIRRSWLFVNVQRQVIARAASRMLAMESGIASREAAAEEAQEEEEEEEEEKEATQARRRLSEIERLPEEIQVQIMKTLDHESLYRLSQTTAHFLRLSFDPAFEAEPAWRAFRHTVDGLGKGPRERMRQVPATMGLFRVDEEAQVTKAYVPTPRSERGDRQGEPGLLKVVEVGQGAAEETDEGETILDFFSR